jgi:hypothetical protein
VWTAGRAAVQGVFPRGDRELRVCQERLEQCLAVDRHFGRGGNPLALNDMICSYVVFVFFGGVLCSVPFERR